MQGLGLGLRKMATVLSCWVTTADALIRVSSSYCVVSVYVSTDARNVWST